MELLVVPAKDIRKYEKCKRILLVDIREREEYDKGHWESAVNIPYSELDYYKQDFKKYSLILFLCERGNLSLRATRENEGDGYRTGSIAGGYEALARER